MFNECIVIMVVDNDSSRVSYRVFLSELNADEWEEENRNKNLSYIRLKANVEDAYVMSDAWWE